MIGLCILLCYIKKIKQSSVDFLNLETKFNTFCILMTHFDLYFSFTILITNIIILLFSEIYLTRV